MNHISTNKRRLFNFWESTDIDKELKMLLNRGFEVDEKTGQILLFNANKFVSFVLKQFKILFADDGFFYYGHKKTGIWVRKGLFEILKILRDFLHKARSNTWTTKMEAEYLEALKRSSYYKGDLNPFRHLINMINGVFDTQNMEFLPHDLNHISTIQIPVRYDANAKCPLFLKFLHQVFAGDKEKIAVLQEWFGYAMTAETKAQKALILYGKGGNGKGVLMHILTKLIGEGNIASLSLNELERPFSRVCLVNKTINISNENEFNGKSFNTQYFKSIVGEDIITVEQKNQPVFSIKPTVKFILSMNNLPTSLDKSDGFYRRLMILGFDVSFSGKSQDKDLRLKLEKELSGIFNWSLIGLKRLRDNNFNFSNCKSMEDIIEKYKQEQNPVLAFFNECIKEDSSYRESNSRIFGAFKEWASQNAPKHVGIANQIFWREFENVAESKGIKISSGHSGSKRFHTGVRIVEDNISCNQPAKSGRSVSSLFSD